MTTDTSVKLTRAACLYLAIGLATVVESLFGLGLREASAQYRTAVTSSTLTLRSSERLFATKAQFKVRNSSRRLFCLDRSGRVFAGFREVKRRTVFLVPIPAKGLRYNGKGFSRRAAATLCVNSISAAGSGSSSSIASTGSSSSASSVANSSSLSSSQSSSQQSSLQSSQSTSSSTSSATSSNNSSSSNSSSQQSSSQSSVGSSQSSSISSSISSASSSSSMTSASSASSGGSATSSSSTSSQQSSSQSSVGSSQSSSISSSSSSSMTSASSASSGGSATSSSSASSQQSSSQSSSQPGSSSSSSNSSSSQSSVASAQLDPVFGLCSPTRLGLTGIGSGSWTLIEAGRSFSNGDYLLVTHGFEEVILARATAACSLRSNWGVQGIARMRMPTDWPQVPGIGRWLRPNDVKITIEDRVIVTGGMPQLSPSSSPRHYSYLGIFASNGLPDPQAIDYPSFKVFPSDGSVSTRLSSLNEGTAAERWIALGANFIDSIEGGNPIWMFHFNGSFDSSVWPGGIGRSQIDFSPALSSEAFGTAQLVTVGYLQGATLVVRQFDLFTGNLVPTYGVNGVASIDLSSFGALSGGFVVGGYTETDGSQLLTLHTGPSRSSSTRVLIVKLNADGSLRSDFGQGGIVVAQAPEAVAPPSEPAPIVRLSDGRFILFAATYLGQSDPSWATHVSRYLPSGALDLTFGQDGYLDLDVALAELGYTPRAGVTPPPAIHVAPDNSLIAGEGVRHWRLLQQ